MEAVLYLFIFFAALVAVPLITCAIQWIKYGNEIPTTIFLSIAEIAFLAIVIATCINWSRPIETTVVDADGKVITMRSERHQLDRNGDEVTFHIDGRFTTFCNVKKVTYRYIDED